MIVRTFLFALLLIAVSGSRAADGRSVVVVYNTQLPASKTIADYYAEKRGVPAQQVIGISITDSEAISRQVYDKELVEPLLQKIEQLKLMTFTARKWTNAAGKEQESPIVTDSKIRYAALCYGMPLKIKQDNAIQEPNPDNALAITIRNEAAIDSELALLPMHYAKLSLNGPIRNRFYATTNIPAMNPTNGLLMVARLDGPSAEVVRSMIDKSLQAEKEGLWGRAYIDLRGITNGEYKVGDDMLRAAGKTVARYGFETIYDDQPAVFPAGFPMPQIGLYVGWYEMNPTGAFTQPAMEFMPGAFAYHLHSFSGEYIHMLERWVAPLLAKGASCTMGSVYEPFLTGTPDIAVFLGHWLFEGTTFAEAAYASQKMLSWQTTFVGDPLYSPFSKKPQYRHEQLIAEKSKLLDWSLLNVANINLVTDLPADQVISFLREQPQTKTSALLSEKLGDMMKAKGKWFDAIELYERALTLNPTPQQRLKITLLLAPMQTNFGKDKRAYELYQSIIRDYPNYPDMARIYQKIVPLAEKVGKSGESVEYGRLLKELTPKPTPKP